MTQLTGVHHVALAVTDIERSVPWYVRVLGFDEETRRQHAETGLWNVVLRAPQGNLLVMLVQHADIELRKRQERQKGLDHIAFTAESPAELRRWEERLTNYGIGFIPARPSLTLPGSWVLVFHDPDGIQIEIWTHSEE